MTQPPNPSRPAMTEAEREAMVALATRCEAATGPNYALERDIWNAIGCPAIRPIPVYTASLDAAWSLIEDGWDWSMHNTGSDTFGPFSVSLGDPLRFRDVEARTLPLAICAAALLARANQGTPA